LFLNGERERDGMAVPASVRLALAIRFAPSGSEAALAVTLTTGGPPMTPQRSHPHSPDEDAGEATVIHFTGRKVSLNEETLESVRDRLAALVEESGPSRLLLDFRNVEYVSSQALGTLVSLHKKGLAAGRRLALRNLSPLVAEVFAVTRLDSFLDVRPAEPEDVVPSGGPRQDLWIEIPYKEGERC
jgi:anti-sigma B factor antagonist